MATMRSSSTTRMRGAPASSCISDTAIELSLSSANNGQLRYYGCVVRDYTAQAGTPIPHLYIQTCSDDLHSGRAIAGHGSTGCAMNDWIRSDVATEVAGGEVHPCT